MVLVRADASSTIGTGHIMRDLVLAKEFDEVVFVTQNLQGNCNQLIEQNNYRYHTLSNNDYETFSLVIQKYNPHTIVLDHYSIGYEFEKKLKEEYPKIKLFVLDDTYKKHYCDTLYNHNIFAKKEHYTSLVPPWCKVVCAKTLLRDEFYLAKKQPKNTKDFRVLVAMGGADTANLSPKVALVLQQFNCNIDVVTTSSNTHLKELQSIKNITLHVNTKNIAMLMRQSSLAVVTPSVILNEVFFMELDFIAIEAAENQQTMAGYLKENSHDVLKNSNSVQKELKNLLIKHGLKLKNN